MELRPASDGDFDAIAALTNHYIATTAIHFGIAPVSAADLRGDWRAHPEHAFFVATRGAQGALAGYAKSYQWRTREAYRLTCEVGIYVAPDAQRSGVGRLLYARLLDELRARGFHSAIGGITLPNDASIGLHRAFGFEHVGTVREAGFKLGRWHDVAFYQKLL